MPNPFRNRYTGRMTTANDPDGDVTPVTRPAEPRPGVTLDVLLQRALGADVTFPPPAREATE